MSNITIAIPPFPCQDLAKLVLGYLAEEQLMTAYDEFLQSSPYLDAFRNEYDRIFMTSLKNILAEYRAVKIYVETCKPLILRRKLFQCTNLLEIVKFLVSHVDLNKIHAQEGGADKPGPTSQTTSQIEASALGSSVEATSLADLPGNTSHKKFITKVPEIGSNVFNPITSSEQTKDGKAVKCSDNLYSTSIEASDTTDNVISSVTEKNYSPNTNFLVNDHNSKPPQRVQDLNDVLNLVSHNRTDSTSNQKDFVNTENVPCKRISSDATLQDLTSVVDSSSINKVIVPDSSTSETNVLQSSTSETDNITNSTSMNKGATRTPLFIKIGNDNKHINLYQNQTLHNLPRLASKESVWKSVKSNIEEQNSPKITIISDVKVDKDVKMPPILKNINTTPLVQMQTLFINGTPVYKQTPQAEQKYTKDEIMAMPTIILVPATDASKKTVPTVTQNNMIDHTENPTIDITASDDDPSQIDNTILESSVQNSQKNTNNTETNKPVEVTVHGSLPKDTLASLKTSTPHVLPPTRKSSSTPRRTSHIRVLDFTTPRRILHENVSEQVGGGSTSQEIPSEAVSLPLSNKSNSEPTVTKPSNISDTVNSSDVDKGPTKENKATIKLYNWDSQLRALAYVGNGNIGKSETIEKPKSKKSKKKISPVQHKDKSKDKHDKESSSLKKNKKVTPKSRSTKLKTKYSEVTDAIEEKAPDKPIIPTVPVKPTINIVSRNKWNDPPEIDKSQSKLNISDERIDTPEMERMSLQNEIGAKLNISDLLETPYKQALYDIQMDTPRFLGTDLPDDPLSDIKITNIPTPRFLNTPKLTQNTPSSYSSRPTDYSSGGSYYKPDEQEYVISTEIMECAQTESASTSNTNKEAEAVEVNVSVQKTCEGKSRPVRKCTKNVSYNYNSPTVNKIKDIDVDKGERSSTCSDISTNKSDKNLDKHNKSEKYNKKEKISIPKKRTKKYKSPVKKESPKTFMKIKPRRTTPVKEVLGKGRKKSSNYSTNIYIKPQPKKLMTGKERNVSFLPVVQVPVSTKSKRKSSSPRKLHCTKMFNSGNSRYNSPENTKQVSKPDTVQVTNLNVYCDSDNEQLPLRWSDDASQESKLKTSEENTSLTNETDDIAKIKEYITTTLPNSVGNIEEGNLQVDLIRRGFDVETARMIERDLLETPAPSVSNLQQPAQIIPCSIPQSSIELDTRKADKSIESDCSTSNNLEIVQDVDGDDEFDLSVHDCNEETNNYFTFKYDEVKFVATEQVKLKETFSMEICMEDDVPIRLRAMPFNTAFEHESNQENVQECNQIAAYKPVSFDSLYTPRKAQCYEIFDSTLASLDTPLKSDSPKAREFETVTEIVLEVEKLENDIKQKPETKKRKRLQPGTSDESSNSNKKAKTDTPYLLNSKSIQNMDIESVLSKLHGP